MLTTIPRPSARGAANVVPPPVASRARIYAGSRSAAPPRPAPSILVTGFPGFVGSALVERLLSTSGPDVRLACLVQPAFVPLATARAEEAMARQAGRAGRLHIIPGDITRAGIGLAAEARHLLSGVQDVYHLAAVYDLGVAPDFARRVNVDGTRRVLDAAATLPGLRRLHYVSTCYVSGRHRGVFRETDLQRGQTFNNAYEETKHRAEVEVRAAMRNGLPATIYRPAIVVGDSRTGATQKYDGPYALLRWALRWPYAAPVPVAPGWRETQFNVVPVDYVVDAMVHLAGLEGSAGLTYHLGDPDPLTVPELLDAVGDATGRRLVPIPVPLAPAVAALSLPGVGMLTGFEPQSLAYTSHPTRYDTTNAIRHLEGSGISCPPLRSYIGRLAEFVRLHRDVRASAMV